MKSGKSTGVPVDLACCMPFRQGGASTWDQVQSLHLKLGFLAYLDPSLPHKADKYLVSQ